MLDIKTFYKDYCEAVFKRRINIDFTYRCPLQCPFCLRQDEASSEMIAKSDDMPKDDWEKILKSFNHFALCGQISDPIYHPQFFDLIKSIRSYPEKTINVHTTGTRKKVNWWKQVFSISKHQIKWIFGLDGIDQETANIYRVNTRFDEVFNVMKLAVDMGCKIEWQFIVFQHNEHQLEELNKICVENKIPLRIVKSSRWDERKIKKYNIHKPSTHWATTRSLKISVIGKEKL